VLSLDDLLHPKSTTLFDELVNRFALKSPLGGVQPKVLAQIENKATLKIDDYIVKAWGQDYPQLAINEYFCIRAVKAAGIAVPVFYLSDDDRYFIMKRFDLLDSGDMLGFEDMCVLQAKKRDDKYSGSYEQLAKTIKTFASASYKNSSLQQFFKMVVMNNLLQNGDAHLKNFGLLYRSIDQVWLAPAYDVVSTSAYIKSDIAALNLLGSKRWHNRKNLIRFGLEACDLSAKQAKLLFDECLNAMETMGVEVRARLDGEADLEKQKILQHLLGLSETYAD
jgi:serine/threonine-protein kinase HipA